MTTELCNCDGASETTTVVPPTPAGEITDQATTWYGNLPDRTGSVFNAAHSTTEALVASVPWSGWAFLILGLLIVLAIVRPRSRNVTNHYHRRSRPQFRPKR
ncbi:hypothetical protein R3X27_25255 [Tropicimonas sp. TH_r6]|uniref:hypothetical protein n=1 Tax=Tropicimonas sp. TH_r6 TaxID=3082085 RepID=UPI0029558DC2|nr:hypothetical protein [Tropicimonas sp. TH_r6]MDV7145991.1 hypothetical protein [Tropicimonas sp. TH_r6]